MKGGGGLRNKDGISMPASSSFFFFTSFSFSLTFLLFFFLYRLVFYGRGSRNEKLGGGSQWPREMIVTEDQYVEDEDIHVRSPREPPLERTISQG